MAGLRARSAVFTQKIQVIPLRKALTIRFDKAGEKRVVDSFVERV